MVKPTFREHSIMSKPTPRDDGTGYEIRKQAIKDDLVRVSRGTPMGELLRRYWHPVGLTKDADSVPRKVRILGEDLILFRDGDGRAGLIHARCCHRGTTLYYGKVEQRGLRCCYHGWLFDVQGHCLEQPCEPNGGLFREKVRQPWYPVLERYGLIFAYLGPPDRKLVFPTYECLEVMGDGELVEADDSSIGGGGPVVIPCNWLQHYENVVDPFHVPVLHASFSGAQFTLAMASMPDVIFEASPRGVLARSTRKTDDGKTFYRVTEAVLPTIRAVANPRSDGTASCSLLGWVLPIDDTNFRIYSAGRVTTPGALGQIRSRFNGKLWHAMNEDEHREYPGDYEAQVSQGPITLHSEEHLVGSDKGVGLLRLLLRQQAAAVERGEDPMGTAFDERTALVSLEAGTTVSTDAPGAVQSSEP
jgi:phenylpropionate dioxygenase-like ring-hydroxylating dioxygenase large terminal subunit